jgi:CheY-like chemotaxis protein
MAAAPQVPDCGLARVLLVDDDPASRLTLQTVLETCGYRVESAATAAEAVWKLEEGEYALVLSDLQMETPQAGLKVLAHAKHMDYRPATALLTTYREAQSGPESWPNSLLIKPEDIQDLVTKIAALISDRATRRLRREMVLAGA